MSDMFDTFYDIHNYLFLKDSINKYIIEEIDYLKLKKSTAQFGIYKQRDKKFMVRIRITGGDLKTELISKLIKIADNHAVNFIHLSSRQACQLHGINIKELFPIFTQCLEEKITFRGGGGDTFRNAAACSHSGFSEDSVFDVLPYAKQTTYSLFQYEKAFTLPRKFKIAFSCCKNDCSLAKLTDLGFLAKIENNVKGFEVYAGGGMGHGSSTGIKLKDFIKSEEVLSYTSAMVDLFDQHGDRNNRNKARIRFILSKYGEEKFKSLFFEFLKNTPNLAKTTLSKPLSIESLFTKATVEKTSNNKIIDEKSFHNWQSIAINETKFDNILLVKLFVPFGDLTVEDLKFIHNLFLQYGITFSRMTRTENLLFPIKKSDLNSVYNTIISHKPIKDFTGSSFNGLITACVGAKTCKIGIINSHKFANSITKELDEIFKNNEDLKIDCFNTLIESIKVSGCPNSCSNHLAGPLGFQGIRKKNKNGVPTDYCKIFLGGNHNYINTKAENSLVDCNEIGIYVKNLIEKFLIKKEDDSEYKLCDLFKSLY